MLQALRVGPRALRSRRRPQGDAGAATLEATGMWGLGAVLALAVALVVLAGAPGVGDAVRRAICIVVTLGQGDCGSAPLSPQERVPSTPCVLTASGHESKVKVAVVVEVGTGEQWLVEELSDGRYRVTRGTNGAVGVGVGVGLTVQATVDGKPYGVAAAAGAGATATFREGETHYASDPEAVARLLEGHAADVAKDAAVGGGGPIRWLADKATGWVDDDWVLPEPQERYVEGGVTLKADAKATWLMAGAGAEVGITGVLGARLGADGTTTEYLSATLSGKLSGGTWAGSDTGGYVHAEARAGGTVNGVVEVERDAEGAVTAVRTRLVTKHDVGATATEAGQTDGPASEGYTERVLELPVRDARDRQVALGYMRSLGLHDVAGLTVPASPLLTSPVDSVAGTLAFAEAVSSRGTVTEQDFDDSGTNHGVDIGGKLLGEVSGGGEIVTTSLASTGARYWDGAQWQDWDACA